MECPSSQSQPPLHGHSSQSHGSTVSLSVTGHIYRRPTTYHATRDRTGANGAQNAAMSVPTAVINAVVLTPASTAFHYPRCIISTFQCCGSVLGRSMWKDVRCPLSCASQTVTSEDRGGRQRREAEGEQGEELGGRGGEQRRRGG